MKSSRIIYLDILRIIATFAVIILHTAANQWYETPVNTFDWQILNIYDSLVRWCVPIFLMISGVFFLDDTKNISNYNIFHKYIKRILSALIFWGLLYGFVSLITKSFINHIKILPFDIMKIFAKLIFGPPWYHLWFLYLMIGIYILTPLLRVFVSNSNRDDIEYLLVLFFLLGLVIPALNKVFMLINSKYTINFSVIELTGYVGYFFAGYYFSKYEMSKKLKYTIYVFGIISVLITIIITAKYSLFVGKPKGDLYSYLLPTTMFESYAVFLLFKNIFKSVKYSEMFEKVITYLASCTFGVYLVHDFINQAFSIIGLKTTTYNPIIIIPLMSFINIVISFIIISFIKKIPFLNRYII
jgi:surface polysaccharide O-acyltransferase-like enzyme